MTGVAGATPVGEGSRAFFSEAGGSFWQGFIIFPMRLSAGGPESALDPRVVNPDIPKGLRDVVR
jgi:hypothetical protein